MLITKKLPPSDDFYRVDQDRVIITEDTELRTSGMTTCSAILVKQGSKRLLAHIAGGSDAPSKINQLENCIRENFDLSDPGLEIVTVPGDGMEPTTQSMAILNKTCEQLGIQPKQFNIYSSYYNDLVFDKTGATWETPKIRTPKEKQLDRGGLKYKFCFNVTPEHVRTNATGQIEMYSPHADRWDVMRDAILDKSYYPDEDTRAYEDPDGTMIGIYRPD